MSDKVKNYEMIPPSELIPYEDNPKIHTAESTDVLCALIKKYGFEDPIKIDQNNRVIAGHGRLIAALKLNLMTVPCLRRQVTDEREYVNRVLADNKVSELSKWSKKQLQTCLTILGDLTDLPVIGFSDKEIDKIFGVKHEDISGTGDFGGDNTVTTDGADDRALVKRKVFMFTETEYKFVTNKLKAIKKEHGLDHEAEAFIKALEPYKGLTKIERRPGPVKTTKGGK